MEDGPDRKLAVVGLALATAIACAAPASTSGAAVASASAATGGRNAPTAATSRTTTSTAGPTLRQVLTVSKVSEYAVVYKITERYGRDSFSGEQSWFVKPPRARFDSSSDVGGERTTVSLYALADGTYVCFKDVVQSRCFGMSGRTAALQQNTAASVQEALVQHPEQFDGVLVETAQIAGQQAHCYDVRALTAQVSGLAGGRFCYSSQGIPLLSRFSTQGGEVSMEAISLSTTVADSEFTLPAGPTTPGRP